MAVEKALTLVTFPAGADLSAKQYHLLEQASDGEVTAANAAADVIVGVLQDKPAAAARAAGVATAGISKVAASSTAASGGFTPGQALVANAAGKAAKFDGTSANAYIIGRSMDTVTTGTAAGVGNSIISMHITHEGQGSTV